MNNTVYPLDYPVEKVVKSTFIKFSIGNIMLTLFNSANLHVMLYDEGSRAIDSVNLTIFGEEYELWNSDEYLVNWVKFQIASLNLKY